MSQHASTPSGASASTRNPRTGRSAATKAKRPRRKRKSRSFFAPWQWAALAVLLVAIVAAFVYWGLGKSRLNALRYAREQGKRYEDVTVIVAHLGGGISVNLHHGGRIVDFINDEAGSFSPERTGALYDAFLRRAEEKPLQYGKKNS